MGVNGMVSPGFAPVRDAFAEVVASQPGTGAAVAVWHDGEWIVDLWGGSASADGSRLWQADSLAMVYSVSKPFVAACALMLVERGVIELDAPVQRYWPEFKAPGSVRELLSHQLGVVALDDPAPTDLLYDWHGLCDRLAATDSAWVRGEGLGECALFYGHLVGEVVRRSDGRMPGAFLRDEVCGPLGIEVMLGLTGAEQRRAVELTGVDVAFRERTARDRPDLFRRAFANPPGVQDAAVVNGRAWRSAQVPAVNAHATARGVAGFYAALLDGRLLAPTVLAEATRPACSGPDLVLGSESTWGLGFALDDDGFGMGGVGGSLGWASVRGDYAIGFVTGSMNPEGGADAVEGVLRECLGLPPLAE